MTACTMETRLPELITEALLMLCKAQIDYGKTLEVIGSVHIKSDGNKVASFLIEKLVDTGKSHIASFEHYDPDTDILKQDMIDAEYHSSDGYVSKPESPRESSQVNSNSIQRSGGIKTLNTLPSKNRRKEIRDKVSKRKSASLPSPRVINDVPPEEAVYSESFEHVNDHEEDDDISLQVIEIDDNCEIKLANSSRKKKRNSEMASYENSNTSVIGEASYIMADEVNNGQPDFSPKVVKQEQDGGVTEESAMEDENGDAETFPAFPELNPAFPELNQVNDIGEKTDYDEFSGKTNAEMVSESGLQKEPCPHCSVPITKYYLAEHIDSVHRKSTIFICEKCEYSTYSKAALRMHQLRNHGLRVHSNKPVAKKKKIFEEVIEYNYD